MKKLKLSKANVFIVAAFLAAVQLPLCGQEARSTILGRVSDSSGAVIVGAKVEGLNTATGVHASATTNESGDYLLPYLIPGPYTVTVGATGFRTFKRTAIDLRMDDHVTVDAARPTAEGVAPPPVNNNGNGSAAGSGFNQLRNEFLTAARRVATT